MFMTWDSQARLPDVHPAPGSWQGHGVSDGRLGVKVAACHCGFYGPFVSWTELAGGEPGVGGEGAGSVSAANPMRLAR